jgi:prepilin peptidase CpaA
VLIAPVTIIAAALATGWDLKTGRIPNMITFPAMLLGLILNTYYSGWHGLGTSLAGLGLGILLLFIPFAVGGMGAGDVKLLAAVGALNGHLFTFRAFLYGAIAGGIMALAVALFKGKLGLSLMNTFTSLGNLGLNVLSATKAGLGTGTGISSVTGKTSIITSGISFPYGIAILAGTLAAYLIGPV